MRGKWEDTPCSSPWKSVQSDERRGPRKGDGGGEDSGRFQNQTSTAKIKEIRVFGLSLSSLLWLPSKNFNPSLKPSLSRFLSPQIQAHLCH